MVGGLWWGPEGVGARTQKRWGPKGLGLRRVGGRKFRAFFSLPQEISFFLHSLGGEGSFSWNFGGVFEGRDHLAKYGHENDLAKFRFFWPHPVLAKCGHDRLKGGGTSKGFKFEHTTKTTTPSPPKKNTRTQKNQRNQKQSRVERRSMLGGRDRGWEGAKG